MSAGERAGSWQMRPMRSMHDCHVTSVIAVVPLAMVALIVSGGSLPVSETGVCKPSMISAVMLSGRAA